MKKVIFIILLLFVGSYGYSAIKNNPSEITDPVYVESRVILNIPELSRELEYVLVGEMASQEDCQKRSVRYLNNLFEKCATCNIKILKCDANLAQRYLRLFSGHRTHTTYLSFDRGSRFERNGRMVIWGMTVEEANMACQQIKEMIKEKYTGNVQCVAGRES